MPDIVVEKASLNDASQLTEIENECFSSDKISPRQMRYLLTKAKAEVFLVRLEAVVAGYCIVLLPAFPRPARIYSIAVRKKYRGLTIAQKLLVAVRTETKQRGYGAIRLEVSCKNKAAQKLYSWMGFIEICFLKKYYENGDDGVRMQYLFPPVSSAELAPSV